MAVYDRDPILLYTAQVWAESLKKNAECGIETIRTIVGNRWSENLLLHTVSEPAIVLPELMPLLP